MEECRCGVYWVVYTRPGIHGSELEGEGAATGLTTECSITTPHSPSHTHHAATQWSARGRKVEAEWQTTGNMP